MKKKLITSALPYVNNIPHLGNLIQVLSADVFARFCRSRGYDTLYVCGTDEYGTATETKALEENKTARELCDYYHKIHADIYQWFNIEFDYFGRTSTPQQTEIVQSLFNDLDKNGYINEKTIEQLFCPDCNRFLADRYVRGMCPNCGYDDARGDQCESCGKLLEPTELKKPRCLTCSTTPKLKQTKHLYINLPAIQEKYAPWLNKASNEGKWAKNAVQMTQGWIRDGLHERAITRDLKWGIPVPKKGFEDKVFYVWFDAPIGYMSITKALADTLKTKGKNFDWKSWWLPEESSQNNEKTTKKIENTNTDVELFQFIGKDNIPFHTVIFPSTLIGSGKNWTKLYHMSSTEYLNYEAGKFSKSKGIGVFGSDAKESGISSDVWRFYIFYNRPEKADTQFTWKDFQDKINSELVGNLANLVNRTLTFVARYYNGVIPNAEINKSFWNLIFEEEKKATEYFEWANLKDAFHQVFVISSIANKVFQDGEPWKTRISDPEKAAILIRDLCYVIKDLMIMAHPFIPSYSEKVLSFLEKKIAYSTQTKKVQKSAETLDWSDLGKIEGLSTVKTPEIIFTPLDTTRMEAYRVQYAGSQKERAEKEKTTQVAKKTDEKTDSQKQKTEQKEKQPSAVELEAQNDPVAFFNKHIQLKVAKIIDIQKHPEADKLYVEKLDDGSGVERTILSGLVPYYKAEELLGKHVIIADNLKPRKMRGIESRGMLLAADYTDEEGKEIVEVLDCAEIPVGTLVVLEDSDPAQQKDIEIDADTFFAIHIKACNNSVQINGKKLLANNSEIKTVKVKNGEVG